jgi:hypothetical protein
MQGTYFLGSFYEECHEEYRRFASLEYWHGVRQKPRADNVMRSVIAYTMRTKEPGRKALQNRVYKYARVLEHFYQNEVLSDEVPQRLKDSGGIDAIYAAICRGASDTLTAGIQAPSAAGKIDGDGRRSYDDGDGGTDEGQRKPVPLLTTASDPRDTLRHELQATGAAKPGPLNRINLETTLATEMFGYDLKEILQAKRATIRVIVEPPDVRGWVTVRAVSVLTSNDLEGPGQVSLPLGATTMSGLEHSTTRRAGSH